MNHLPLQLEVRQQIEARIKWVSETPDYKFVADNLDATVSESIEKYSKGFKEHGGSIFDRPLLQEAKAEIIDLNQYLRAMEVKISSITRQLETLKKCVSKGDEHLFERIIDQLNKL